MMRMTTTLMVMMVTMIVMWTWMATYEVWLTILNTTLRGNPASICTSATAISHVAKPAILMASHHLHMSTRTGAMVRVESSVQLFLVLLWHLLSHTPQHRIIQVGMLRLTRHIDNVDHVLPFVLLQLGRRISRLRLLAWLQLPVYHHQRLSLRHKQTRAPL
jgi:hypothetical protein